MTEAQLAYSTDDNSHCYHVQASSMITRVVLTGLANSMLS